MAFRYLVCFVSASSVFVGAVHDCWDTFYMFADCGFVNPHLTAEI